MISDSSLSAPPSHPDSNTRSQFTFRATGLSSRNEILLKSLMRLLQGVTQHEWVYSPFAQDMVVVATENPGLPGSMGNAPAPSPTTSRLQLWAGDSGEGKPYRVALPLNYKQLEEVLNRAGEWLQAHPVAPSIEPTAVHPDERFQLECWPPAKFLTTPSRAKAAAMLLKAPMTVGALARRIDWSVQECESFVVSLPRMKRTPSDQNTSILSAWLGGNSQLGVNTALPSAEDSAGVRPPLKGEGRNLLTLIRNRLGLKS